MKRNIRKLLPVVAVALVSFVLIGRLPVLAAKRPVVAGVSQAKLCSDLRMTISKQVTLTPGEVLLKGTLINDGPGTYSYPASALKASFMVYTWYPPKTPAQCGIIDNYAPTDMGTVLKKGESKSFSYTLKISNFSRWGHFPTSATERQASKQFVARVDRTPQGFSPCEDSDNTNTFAVITEVPYMEKIQTQKQRLEVPVVNPH